MALTPTTPTTYTRQILSLTQFLEEYQTAVWTCQAAVPADFPHVWPQGGLIRVRVPEMAPGRVGPLLLDPIGLVWFARTGQLKGVLSSLELGWVLGLAEGDLEDVLQASDGRVREGSLRAMLEGPLLSPQSPRRI